jgi:signal transduction histidine kinase
LSATEDRPEQDARTMIHDFRNLLAVIVNYSELIAEETDDPEAVRADIQEIRLAAERAIAMTDKLPRGGPRSPEAAT